MGSSCFCAGRLRWKQMVKGIKGGISRRNEEQKKREGH